MREPGRSTVNIDGGETSVWQYGDPSGETLVFVHGFRGDHHGLEPLAIRLREFNVLVPDLPGFGRSAPLAGPHSLAGYADWLRSFTAAVAPEGFSLMGHSFGSLIVSTAIREGLNARTVTLINPISAPALEGPRGLLTRGAILYYRLGAQLPEPVANALLRNPAIVRVMSETMAKTRDTGLRAWIHDQHARYFSAFSDRVSLLEAFEASVSHTVREDAAAFTEPTLLIVGDRDDITPLSDQLKLLHELPDARLHIVGGVGHLIHYEAPAEAAEVLRGFLSSPAVETTRVA